MGLPSRVHRCVTRATVNRRTAAAGRKRGRGLGGARVGRAGAGTRHNERGEVCFELDAGPSPSTSNICLFPASDGGGEARRRPGDAEEGRGGGREGEAPGRLGLVGVYIRPESGRSSATFPLHHPRKEMAFNKTILVAVALVAVFSQVRGWVGAGCWATRAVQRASMDRAGRACKCSAVQCKCKCCVSVQWSVHRIRGQCSVVK